MDNKKMLKRFEALCKILPLRLQSAVLKMDEPTQLAAQELRLRVNRPLQISLNGQIEFLGDRGKTTPRSNESSIIVSSQEIFDVFRAVCGYSVHTHQSEIADGFITFEGGHRVGICGTAVINDGIVSGMRDISSLNIRIAKEIRGCAEKVIKYSNYGCKGMLLAGPPSSGKTTMLRDLARLLAGDGICNIKKVALLDERGELAAMWQGVPQNDVGICTDILSGYTKKKAILMAIRTLSPDIIICDEIGREDDIDAIKTGAVCGVKLIASVHAATIDEVLKKPFVKELAALGAFDTIVLLNGCERVGEIKEVRELVNNE
ncbi:MAG: stage III sporulation protein AA [Hydrogenoanaerobacterium sp.]